MSFVDSLVSHFKYNFKYDGVKKPQDVLGSALEPNDIISIRQSLSDDSAAIVNINTFSLEIAEKMRQAIHDASSKNSGMPFFSSTKPGYFYFNPEKRNAVQELVLKSSNGSFEKDWRNFKAWLQNKTQIISSEEIEQFQKEVDEYVEQIKQMISEVDGQSIELYRFVIRTEKGRFEPGHKHTSFGRNPNYILASIAPIGLGTFYMRSFDVVGDRIVSNSGHTVILSEGGRIRKMREPAFYPFHGTPGISEERLFFLFSFTLSK